MSGIVCPVSEISGLDTPRPSRWPDGERWRVVKTKLLAYSVGAASSRRRVADVPVLAAGRDVEDVARLSPQPGGCAVELYHRGG